MKHFFFWACPSFTKYNWMLQLLCSRLLTKISSTIAMLKKKIIPSLKKVIDLDIFKHFTYYIYFICLVLLLGIILLAGTDYSAEINGALGWYQIKSVSIQPAELMKFGFILMLAKLLDSHKYKKDSLGNELFLIGKRNINGKILTE